MLRSISVLEHTHFGPQSYLASHAPSWHCSIQALKTSLPRPPRRKLVPKGRLDRSDPRRMRAAGCEGKANRDRTAGQETSARRDVARETSSVVEEKKARRAAESAPDLSDSEDSDSAPNSVESQTPLEKRKKQVVENVMAIVMQWLDMTFPPRQHCSNDSAFRSRGTSGGGGRGAKKGRYCDGDENDKENAAPQRQKKRQQRDESPGGDEDGDGERGGNGSKRAKKDPEETQRRLACPFYKHDPSKHKTSRACRFPGFDSMHRLKEHIYRTHLSRLVCPRCGDRFKTEGALDVHLRADDVCKKGMIAQDGIDREQEKKIRARPRKDNTTDEQKWVAMYKIIFPDTPEDSIPSPYCDDQQSQSLDGMNEYLRRGLGNIVRRQLEEEVEQMMSNTEKDLVTKVVDNLPRLARRLIAIYRREGDRDDEALAPVSPDAAAANDSQSIDRMLQGFDPLSFDNPDVLGDLGPSYGLLDNAFDPVYEEPLNLSAFSHYTS